MNVQKKNRSLVFLLTVIWALGGVDQFFSLASVCVGQQSTGKAKNSGSDFQEPTKVLGVWKGENAGDQFGWTARRAGDVDKDGVIDFIATAPTFGNGKGKVYVYSSKMKKLIHAFEGKKGFRLGNSAVGIGDLDKDNIPDFVIGAPGAYGKGAALVYSGRTGKKLLEVQGKTRGAQFGYEVSEVGDFDGDGVPDFFVGALRGSGVVSQSGMGYVFSGKDGKQILQIQGERTGDGFGNAAAGIQLASGDFLLAIGANNAGPNKRGRVYVYQVTEKKAKLKFKIEGDSNSANLGQMFISFPGDINKDGVPDVYASDFGDRTKVRGGGKVVVHSGIDGKKLIEIFGVHPGEGLGTSPSDAGDVDGDGVGDLIIGAWQNRQGAISGGKVYLYSLKGKGKLLRSWTCTRKGDTFGFDACGIGDVNGDGKIDFLLTSAWSDIKGPKTGRVFIVSGEDMPNK